mgnify:CR=1 FL=1
MKEEIKDPRLMTVKLRLEVANALRDLCSKTGITLTRAVNNAVEAYMPVIQKLVEAMNDASVTSENPANISTNVDFDKLYDSLYEDCLEIIFNEDDFAPTYTFKEIAEKTIEENPMYRNAGLKYERFLDFLERRYGLMTTQSRKQ